MKISNKQLISGIKNVYIGAVARTPVGSFQKTLAPCSAHFLGSVAIKGVLEKSKIPITAIEGVYMGQVCQANAGQDPARQATLAAGLGEAVTTFTVNKVCASGMKAIMLAAQGIQLGSETVMIAGGQESMSNVPFYLPRTLTPLGHQQLVDGIIKDGLTNAYGSFLHMGSCAELTVTATNTTREEQDDFAKESYTRSQKAASSGVFDAEIVPVLFTQGRGLRAKEVVVKEDEEYQKSDFSRFSSLSPAFEKTGTITAANASTLNDGAAATLLMSKEALSRHSVTPLAKIVAFCDAATKPEDFALAPVFAIKKLLSLTDRSVGDISLWELNEAFSVVVVAAIKDLKLNPDLVNIHGGAVSIGHPIGMSGTRITNHLAMSLKKGQLGVAAICNGGGGASAIMLEGMRLN